MDAIAEPTPIDPTTQTLYIPIVSPPTPAPSPGPSPSFPLISAPLPFASLSPTSRRTYLSTLLSSCTPSELLFISTAIAPLLKRDFLRDLPPELALHILGFVDDPKTLVRAGQVSKAWERLLNDECVWGRMCARFGFEVTQEVSVVAEDEDEPLEEMEEFAVLPMDPALEWLTARKRMARRAKVKASPRPDIVFSYRRHFKYSYITTMNWRHGGHLLRSHRVPVLSPDTGVVTSVALDADWVVVGLANCRIHVFSARTGVLSRTLVGHEQGVWAVVLVSKGGYWGGGSVEEDVTDRMEGMNLAEDLVPPSLRTALGLDTSPRRRSEPHKPKPSDPCNASRGWGQPSSLVVSGGCDKSVRVWDVKSGYCIYVLAGHTSTIRCIRVLDSRPVAVTGSRDGTVRVWDVRRGRGVRVLEGHRGSVRCLDVCGDRVVSGSYDTTCRVWNVDTGECLFVLRGHLHQIYCVAFDGERIASGGLDTTVRVWSASTGKCIASLHGHTALVCQLQLSPTLLATGGSDGRVITFSLSTYTALQRMLAHDSSVTSLQFDETFLVTGGNDGRVRLFETQTGNYVRELSAGCEGVWKVVWRREVCAVMCKRAGKTVMEIWSFKPRVEV